MLQEDQTHDQPRAKLQEISPGKAENQPVGTLRNTSCNFRQELVPSEVEPTPSAIYTHYNDETYWKADSP